MKHHIVVGGSKGIGKEFVKKLLRKNHKVTILSRNPIKIKSKNLTHISIDLNNLEDLKEKCQSIISIDSISFFQKYRPKNNQDFSLEEEFNVSINSTEEIIKNCKKQFKKNGNRSIVIIGSIASSFIASEQPSNYHISKSALLGLVKFYAIELAKEDIKVNMVSPCTVLKEENKNFYKKNKKLSSLYKKVSPLKKMITSKDVSNLVYYFSSKKSNLITGQNIIIDGGISLQWQESLAREVSTINTKVTQN